MELLKIERLTKTYGAKKSAALSGFDLSLQKGEMLAIMGKSGSGKSTVLNIIAGIDEKSNGRVLFEEKDMSEMNQGQMTRFRRENLGVVFQHFALVDDYSVYANIALPLKLRGVRRAEVERRVRAVAAELGITKLLEKYPRELSGGEAQRTAIARAIITEPKLILADEPTGALDEENGRKIMEIFHRLHRKGNTLIIVTHDPAVAAACERTVRIRDGRNEVCV